MSAARSEIAAAALAAALVADGGLERETALAGGRGELFESEPEGDRIGAAEPHEAGGGEHDRVEVACLDPCQPGVDVAPQLGHLEIRPQGEQLRTPAQARGPDPRALGEVVEPARAADERVAWILAPGNAHQRQPVRQLARKILCRMDADRHLAGENRPLDPADEA